MSYNFVPMSDDELYSFNLLEAGIYDFEVMSSERKNSKAGNPMAALQLKLWDKNGKTHNIFDYLVFSSIPLNIKKVKHFCDAVGLQEEYKKGEIPEILNGRSGKVDIGVQDQQEKPEGGFWPKKNVVIDYIKNTEKSIKQPPIDHVNNFDDDKIPF